MIEMCKSCGENAVFVKKRMLCSRCYQREVKANNGFLSKDRMPSAPTIAKNDIDREIEFIKNYFTHKNWVRHPATFNIKGIRYTPDFYDSNRNVFIEVAGTRQAYHANKEKYELFRKGFPKIEFEIRKTNGDLLDENGRLDWNITEDFGQLLKENMNA